MLQLECPEEKKCRFAKGEQQVCTAKDSDLTDYCLDCEKPVDECKCGTNWVILSDSKGNVGVIKSGEYGDLERRRLEARQ